MGRIWLPEVEQIVVLLSETLGSERLFLLYYAIHEITFKIHNLA